MKNNLLFILSLLFHVIFIINYLFCNETVYIGIIILTLIANIFLSIYNKNFVLLIFILTFTLFQLSRIILSFFNLSDEIWYKGYVGDLFEKDVRTFILRLDYLVLLGINLSFWLRKRGIYIIPINRIRFNKVFSVNYFNERVALFLFIITIWASIMQNMLIAKYIFSHSYLSFRSGGFTSPYFLIVLSGFSKLFFYIYVTVAPKIKILVVVLFFVNAICSLITGVRIEFMLSILLLICIYLHKQNNFSLHSIKKFIPILIFLCPILFYVGIKRENNSLNSNDNIFINFIKSQGVSIVVPGYFKQYEDSNPNKNFLCFIPQLVHVFENISGKHYKNREDEAKHGYYIAKYISYKVLDKRYSMGEGMGSAFHAELYVIFGSASVVLFSVIISLIAAKLSSIKQGGLKYIISLSLIYWLPYIPRALPMDLFYEIFSVKFWVGICVYIFFNRALKLFLYGKRLK